MNSKQYDFKQKLIEFYKKYAPDKISNVDQILDKYKNHENKLFSRLYEIYNVKAEVKIVIPELDFCNKNFDALKALNSDIELPYSNVQILDNISKCRHLLSPTDPDYLSSTILFKPPRPIKEKKEIISTLDTIVKKYENQGSFSILSKCYKEKIRLIVITRSIKTVKSKCIGYLKCFDKHLNLFMTDVDEYNYSDDNKKKKQRHFNQLIIRGDNIIIVYPEK